MVRTKILLAILTHKENPISKMIICILGIVAEMERKQIKERQKEGIELAKLRGVYKGRVHGSKEDLRTFLSKPKVAKTIEYLKKGYKASEISRIVGIHVNKITKVKKMVGLSYESFSLYTYWDGVC